MMHHKKVTQSLATVALVTILLAGAAPAFAQTTNSQSQGGFFQGLITFIEQKFGLDKTQVQSAVQDYKTQQQANITPRPTLTQQQITDNQKTRLDKLVSNNKITADQEQAILTELVSLESKYNLSSLQGDTPTQRKTTIQSMQSDIKTWAKANNINPLYVMPFGMGDFGRRGMMMRGHGHWGNSVTPTPTPTG